MKNFASMLLIVALASPVIADSGPANAPTIAAFQATDFSVSGTVQVQGYNAPGDSGGGLFVWMPASNAAEDHCTVFKTVGHSTGRLFRQLNGQPLSVDMCGAHHDGSNPVATLAAFQYANDYVAQSSNPNQTILMPGAFYNLGNGNTGVIKAASFFGPKWVGAGQSTGLKATLIQFTPGAEAAAFTFVGGSGSICGCGVQNVIFQGNTNSIGVELQGQGGAIVDVSAFGPMKRVVLLHNKTRSQYSEFDHLTINTNGASAGMGTVLEYRVTGGDASFNGSGLVEGVINYGLDANGGAVLIGAGAFPYNAPLTAMFFPQTAGADMTIVHNASVTAFGEPFFYGEIRAEQGPARSLTTASGADLFLSGNMTFMGNANAWHAGSAHTGYSFGTTPSGAATTFFKPFSAQTFIAGASSKILSWPRNASWNFYRLTLEVRGNNYLAFATLELFFDEGSDRYYVLNQRNNVITDGRSYGDPVITATTGGVFLSASLAPYRANENLLASVTATQVGQGSGHFAQQ